MPTMTKISVPLLISLSLASTGCDGGEASPLASAGGSGEASGGGSGGLDGDLDPPAGTAELEGSGGGASTGGESAESGTASDESGQGSPADDEVVCELGDSRPCECADGGRGYEICVDEDGTYSACGCVTDPDVFEEPEVPQPTQCGELLCDALTEEPTEASAAPCCTDDGQCGLQADFVFGAQCVERFGDPGDLETAECPDEFPHFLDLEGCCLPSGACGLSIDYINNWDIGCIERTRMMQLLNDGKDLRALLAFIFLLGPVEVDYAPMACTPA